ncbi:GCN5-related protein N-acetyltransferase [Beutenbergia cavernae DSM 12333]|uniref:GCN5-related protein N-acetyltransferase n=1 Tax=Beutenbergia cavernae (strain ATCC BAA-8 / DSM 12333 / CCUG 43141 / JCM 11478 / NBRC 16432 / NCIMB 13614 / HKI 0122) TaxID=471853 RepID=C5BVM5_BEUC1|nr:GNAT family N-acetyltransferase [Beutenbergia cavernae]ACQ78465.1 GCN5-related protein N-acetyltransferase [Beutenbergia cavernae DSM 12333]
MTAGELDVVGALRVAAYSVDGLLDASPEYVEELRGLGGDGHGQVLVAVGSGDAVVGTLMLEDFGAHSEVAREAGEIEIRGFAVDPAMRGRGVGRALLAEAEQRAAVRGHRMVLSTLPAMTAARSLYLAQGYEREPDRDWEPLPGLQLLAYGKDLPG